MELSHKGKP
uniref:Uncharacterized protein n=1 Tax=Ficus carica TaxID=3494 RepID=A0AA88JJZ6_FICCA|nr:hypothetical protein TIFTF001_056699 [Ficus carica]GMN75487.1 hypothetical protein TIFTF001_056701 [Ficus carica]